MKRFLFVVISAAAACDGTSDLGSTTDELDSTTDRGQPEPPAAGVQWARGEAPPGGGSPNLIYHGGPVMTTGAHVEAIFWGASWSDPSFVADKTSGLQTFYGGMGGSTYDATNGEYTDSSGGSVGSTVTFAAAHVDLSAAPRRGNKVSPILAEVCSTI